MQVKKFEAPSIAEAIKAIKAELGPDAVILSAKEMQKGYGILKGPTFEVTAAVRDDHLVRRKVAERKMNGSSLERFKNLSATKQKQYIESAFQSRADSQRREDQARRYIDILEDQTDNMQKVSEVAAGSIQRSRNSDLERPVRSANSEVDSLKNEIMNLKRTLEQLSVDKAVSVASQNVQASGAYAGAEFGLRFELAEVFKRFQKSGMREANIVSLLTDAQDELPREQLKKKPVIEAWCVKKMMQEIRLTANPYGTKYHCFVGPAGHGKSSALVKFASDLVLKRRKVAVLTTDTLKVGSIDQMKIFTQILKVPFGVLRGKIDWRQVESQLAHVDHVLIDYPGLSLKHTTEFDYIASQLPTESLRTTHLVLSAAVREDALAPVIQRYQRLDFNDFVMTKLDETTGYGLLYTLQKEFGRPFHSFSIGQNIPDDFEYATKERVVDLIFELSKFAKTLQSRHEGAQL